MISARVKKYAIGLVIFFLGSVTGLGALTAYVWMFVPADETKDCPEGEWDDVRPRFRSFLQVDGSESREPTAASGLIDPLRKEL